MSHIRRKILGQHFLIDKNIALLMIDSLKGLYREGDVVLEVGAGRGALTTLLYDHKFNFLSIEKDKMLYAYLIENYPHLKNYLINGDFRKTKIHELGGSVIIFGSFPYILTGEIIESLIRYYNFVKGALGLFQWEVGQRICAGPGSDYYGAVSVFLNAGFETKVLRKVGPGCFAPPPSVTSCLVSIIKRDEPLIEPEYIYPFAKFVRRFFSYRRKKMKNAVKYLAISGIPEEYYDKRPEEITIEEYISLFRGLYL